MIVHTRSTPTRFPHPVRPRRTAGALATLCFAAALLAPLGGAHTTSNTGTATGAAAHAGTLAFSPQMECSGISVPC